MKAHYKTGLIAITAVAMFIFSCKKSQTPTASSTTDVTAALSKQLAADVAKSLVASSSKTTSSGVKTGSSGTLQLFDATTPCGTVFLTPTFTTTVIGDTTRTIADKNIYTVMCNGFFNNNFTIDAYTLKDTLTVNDKGAAFNNTYNTVVDFVVKATAADYSKVSINGTTNNTNLVTKLSGATVTELHTKTVNYIWQNIISQNSPSGAGIVLGRVVFTIGINDRTGADVTNTSLTENYTGTIDFQSATLLLVTFNLPNNATKVYSVNTLTGETKEV